MQMTRKDGREFFLPRWAMNSWEMSIHRSSCCRKPKANRFSMEDVSSSMSLRPLRGEADTPFWSASAHCPLAGPSSTGLFLISAYSLSLASPCFSPAPGLDQSPAFSLSAGPDFPLQAMPSRRSACCSTALRSTLWLPYGPASVLSPAPKAFLQSLPAAASAQVHGFTCLVTA